jgi:hypothetical protein
MSALLSKSTYNQLLYRSLIVLQLMEEPRKMFRLWNRSKDGRLLPQLTVLATIIKSTTPMPSGKSTHRLNTPLTSLAPVIAIYHDMAYGITSLRGLHLHSDPNI